MLHDLEMRQVYCDTLIELAAEDPRIVIVEADLMKATGTVPFATRYPERAVNVGVAEQNLIGVAAGLAADGKIPFAASFAPFTARRPCDQVFISVAYAGLNVKIVGTAPGVTAEYNGGTHMCFEDVAIMRAIPQMTIISPCDAYELRSALQAIAAYQGPVYLQLIRGKMPPIFDEHYSFEIGRAVSICEGSDVLICATGYTTHLAVEAGRILAETGINAGILHLPTIKPLDEKAVLAAARTAGCIVTVENHNIIGGLGSAVTELTAGQYPVPVRRVGVRDQFGEVGKIPYLVERYRFRPADIAAACQEVIQWKERGYHENSCRRRA